MVKTRLIVWPRSAALRRPQSGTPRQGVSEDDGQEQLVGDEALILLGLQSPCHAALCGVLLRTQIQTYKATRHIISYSDEYSMRRIRNAAKTGRLPNIYCRCMRCGCLALLLDWAVAVYQIDMPLQQPGRPGVGVRIPTNNDFRGRCTGNEIAEEGLLLTEKSD